MFSRSLPSVCPTQRAARHRLPSRGSREPWFPTFVGTMLYEDCLPTPLGSLRLSLASRYRACFRACVGPSRAHARVEAPDHAWACGRPVPSPGLWSRREMALPRSRVPSLHACPARRPRWCPRHAPSRAQDCCLWVRAHRRLSPPYLLRDILLSTTLHISGLHHAACILTPSSFVLPLLGWHVEVAPDVLARRLSGGTESLALTRWGTTTSFMGFRPVPRFRSYLGASML